MELTTHRHLHLWLRSTRFEITVFSCKPGLAITIVRCEKCLSAWRVIWISINGFFTRMHGVKKAMSEVCKLKKSLYGLKQSPRAWFGRFTKSMRVFCYRQSNLDHTLFLKKQHGKITTLIVYVDDMVVTGNDHEKIKAL